MITSYRFQEVKQTDSGRVSCPQCGKTRRLTVSRSYYRNGFHNEADTRKANAEELAQEIAKMIADGVLCSTCEAINHNDPIAKKTGDNAWDIFDRATGEKIGRAVKEGGRLYRCVGLAKGFYAYHSTLVDAGREFLKAKGGNS